LGRKYLAYANLMHGKRLKTGTIYVQELKAGLSVPTTSCYMSR